MYEDRELRIHLERDVARRSPAAVEHDYDKRGIGASASAMGQESHLRFTT